MRMRGNGGSSRLPPSGCGGRSDAGRESGRKQRIQSMQAVRGAISYLRGLGIRPTRAEVAMQSRRSLSTVERCLAADEELANLVLHPTKTKEASSEVRQLKVQLSLAAQANFKRDQENRTLRERVQLLLEENAQLRARERGQSD